MTPNIARSLALPKDSFFLFGPRGVGKSTLLKQKLSPDVSINLLEYDTYRKYLTHPSHIRSLTEPLSRGSWVCIDEVQKLPQLLDEVHSLIENKGLKFALSGSSARKLKRGGANLLAGRAITRFLDPFSYTELQNYNLATHLEFGCLPNVVTKPDFSTDILKTYVNTYLKEEIQEEGLIRKIEPFVRFLEIAAMMNGQLVNGSNIAREAGVPRPNIDNYFSILIDTLIGHWLPAYQPKAQAREVAHPKFYWFDCGVARSAAGLMDQPLDTEWLGRSLETLVYHELRVRKNLISKDFPICYYRLPSGLEIDFVLETRKATLSRKPEILLIEVKNSKKWDRRWARPLLELRDSGKVATKGLYGLYRGHEILSHDGLLVLPIQDFFERLHNGHVF